MKWCPRCRKSFPDPPVSRSDIPAGVQGDVIVEVTIDAEGNVVQNKLLQGIGYGIEQKVLSVLPRWHFRPASKDGVTIASQHIVYFHYPRLRKMPSAHHGMRVVNTFVTQITCGRDNHTPSCSPPRYT